jgi:DNA-binding response OmpR family regulator
VILLDRRLPDADGVELCRAFRAALGAAVPIILITADRAPGLEATARAAGATDFVLKPYHPDALLTRLPRPT